MFKIEALPSQSERLSHLRQQLVEAGGQESHYIIGWEKLFCDISARYRDISRSLIEEQDKAVVEALWNEYIAQVRRKQNFFFYFFIISKRCSHLFIF
jgi:hypothetical protein